jgi:integrase
MLTIRQRGDRSFTVRGTVRFGSTTRIITEHSTGTGERAFAELYARQLTQRIKDELVTGKQADHASLTFSDAALLYLNRPVEVGRDTIWRVGQLADVLGDMRCSDIAQGWQDFITQRCSGLAPATIERFRCVLQAILNHAAATLMVEFPHVPRISFRNQLIRFLQTDERERLIKSYAPHVQPIVLLLAHQGARTQEVLQLRWRHVSLQENTLRFERTKNGLPRTVPMHREVAQMLRHAANDNAQKPDAHVFLNCRGQPYADTRDYCLPGGNPLKRAHQTACDRAGVKNFRVHDWRHDWACRCVQAGLHLEHIRALGGWRDLRMLTRYAGFSVDHLREAINRLA